MSRKYTEKFFEGADFKGKEFKALTPKYYPIKYKKYIAEETKLLKKHLKGANAVLEAGVGIGRLIPILSPLVKDFVGIDNANLMLIQSREVAKKISNVKIIKADLEQISTLFPKKYFDYSLCVWNTLGNVKSEAKVLRQLGKITSKSILITVYKKGTLPDRINWYKTVGVTIKRIDRTNEIFYSESGLRSKSYSLEEVKRLARQVGLKVKQARVLNNVILWAELVGDKNRN